VRKTGLCKCHENDLWGNKGWSGLWREEVVKASRVSHKSIITVELTIRLPAEHWEGMTASYEHPVHTALTGQFKNEAMRDCAQPDRAEFDVRFLGHFSNACHLEVMWSLGGSSGR